jgi:hypothetical protein
VTVEEIRERLFTALPLRVPRFDPSGPAQDKIAAMETYLLETAYHRAELEEARYWLVEAGKELRGRWERVEGHEAMLGSKATKEQVDKAKAEIDPETGAALAEARDLMTAIDRQIKRFGGTDYEAVSRAYTLAVGS